MLSVSAISLLTTTVARLFRDQTGIVLNFNSSWLFVSQNGRCQYALLLLSQSGLIDSPVRLGDCASHSVSQDAIAKPNITPSLKVRGLLPYHFTALFPSPVLLSLGKLRASSAQSRKQNKSPALSPTPQCSPFLPSYSTTRMPAAVPPRKCKGNAMQSRSHAVATGEMEHCPCLSHQQGMTAATIRSRNVTPAAPRNYVDTSAQTWICAFRYIHAE